MGILAQRKPQKGTVYHQTVRLIMIICALISLIYLIAFTWQAYQAVQRNEEIYVNDIVSSASNYADAMLENVASYLTILTRNNEIFALPFNRPDTYNAPLLSLRNAQVQTEMFDKVYIYLAEDSSILSSEYKMYNLESFPDQQIVTDYLNDRLKTWPLRVEGKITHVFLYDDELYMAQNFPLSVQNSLGTIFCKLNLSVLYRGMIDTSQRNDGQLLVFGPDLEHLFHLDSTYPFKIEEAVTRLIDSAMPKLRSNGTYYYCIQSAKLGWYFLYTSQPITFFTTNYLITVLIVIVLVMISGWLLIDYAVRRIFAPVSIILRETDPMLTALQEDEFLLLQRTVDSIIDSRNRLGHVLDDLRPKVSEQFYRELISGSYADSSSIMRILPVINSPFTITGQFLVVIISIPDTPDAHNALETSLEKSLSTFQNSLFAFHAEFLAEQNQTVVLLEFLSDFSKETVSNIWQRISRTIFATASSLTAGFLLGTSHVFHSLVDTPYAYDVALRCLQGYEETSISLSSGDYNHFYVRINRLLGQILSEEPSASQVSLSSCVELLVGEEGQSEALSAFRSAMTDCLYEKFGQIPEGLSGENLSVPMQQTDASLLLFKKQLEEYCCQVEACVRDYHLRRRHKSLLASELYIQQHYSDPALSLSTVAAAVHTSPSYLSKLFNNNMRINFVDYLGKLRIEKACELFQNTGCTVREVCELVGFNSQQNFFRVFKKWMKVSPGQYKEKLK